MAPTNGCVALAGPTTPLQIFTEESVPSGQLEEVAYFDVYPANDDPLFTGTWSNYPFFDEDFVAVSGIDSGLFVLRPSLP